MNKDTKEIIFGFILLVVLFGMLASAFSYAASLRVECESRGGALVRGGFIGFACVAGPNGK